MPCRGGAGGRAGGRAGGGRAGGGPEAGGADAAPRFRSARGAGGADAAPRFGSARGARAGAARVRSARGTVGEAGGARVGGARAGAARVRSARGTVGPRVHAPDASYTHFARPADFGRGDVTELSVDKQLSLHISQHLRSGHERVVRAARVLPVEPECEDQNLALMGLSKDAIFFVIVNYVSAMRAGIGSERA